MHHCCPTVAVDSLPQRKLIVSATASPSTYALVRPVLASDAACHHASCQCCHTSLDGPAFQSLFHILLVESIVFLKDYHDALSSFAQRLVSRLTQTSQWQPSSTARRTKPASSTSQHLYLNQHQHQHQLPHTAILAALTCSFLAEHLPDASEQGLSTLAVRTDPNIPTLRESVSRDSNWRSLGNQQNGSLDP